MYYTLFNNFKVSGSSPDLLSSRGHHFHIAPNRYNASQNMLVNADTHRTYTNLNALLEPRQVYQLNNYFI